VAALCGIDTPIYDPKIYPHNFLPLRYRSMPQPVTIVMGAAPYWTHAQAWRFEYVLIERGVGEPPAGSPASGHERIAAYGTFQLWQRRAP
jgi:hypothetical protein